MAHSKGGSLSLPLTNKPPQPKTTLGAPPGGGAWHHSPLPLPCFAVLPASWTQECLWRQGVGKASAIRCCSSSSSSLCLVSVKQDPLAASVSTPARDAALRRPHSLPCLVFLTLAYNAADKADLLCQPSFFCPNQTAQIQIQILRLLTWKPQAFPPRLEGLGYAVQASSLLLLLLMVPIHSLCPGQKPRIAAIPDGSIEVRRAAVLQGRASGDTLLSSPLLLPKNLSLEVTGVCPWDFLHAKQVLSHRATVPWESGGLGFRKSQQQTREPAQELRTDPGRY